MSTDDDRVPTDEDRASDRELLAALEARRPVGERYARSGRTPTSVPRSPTMHTMASEPRNGDPTPVMQYATGRRTLGRRLALAALVVATLAVAYGAISLWQVWSTGRSDEARPVDAIVVLGAAQYDGRPSPQLAARLDHTVELWNRGLSPTVVVTGGNQPGDRFTEADASRDYLVERGVPESAILAEETGSSTHESLANVAGLLGPRDELLLVTDPYHALRSRLTAEEVGFDTVHVSPTPTSVVTGASNVRRHVGEAAGVALGRIIGFERLSGLTD